MAFSHNLFSRLSYPFLSSPDGSMEMQPLRVAECLQCFFGQKFLVSKSETASYHNKDDSTFPVGGTLPLYIPRNSRSVAIPGSRVELQSHSRSCIYGPGPAFMGQVTTTLSVQTPNTLLLLTTQQRRSSSHWALKLRANSHAFFRGNTLLAILYNIYMTL